jgi:hypothetical protein
MTFRNQSDYITIGKQKIASDRMYLSKEIIAGTIDMGDDTRNQNRIYATVIQEFTKNTGDLLILDTTNAPENGENELFRFRAP